MLQVYPSTIRRQILRFLYYDTLKQTYLFQGIGRAFLDAVLAEASLEVYLPNVSPAKVSALLIERLLLAKLGFQQLLEDLGVGLEGVSRPTFVDQ